MLRKYVTRTTVIVAVGVLAFGGLIAGILLSSNRPADDGKPPTVNLEIRARGRVHVRVSGRDLGLAPRMLVVPASTAPLEVDGDLGHGRLVSKTVVPDHDQIVQLD